MQNNNNNNKSMEPNNTHTYPKSEAIVKHQVYKKRGNCETPTRKKYNICPKYENV